jgi:predicted nucleic acid-binding protein
MSALTDYSELAVYWDASAVVSALAPDAHSAEAIRWSRRPAVHVISTLTFAEVMSAVGRLERVGALAAVMAENARVTAGRTGVWRRLDFVPNWPKMTELSKRWTLRGADLWHLAAADALREEVPTLRLLTFDERLSEAADAIGLGARS